MKKANKIAKTLTEINKKNIKIKASVKYLLDQIKLKPKLTLQH